MKLKVLFILLTLTLMLPSRLSAFEFDGIYYELFWGTDDEGKSIQFASVEYSYEQNYSGDLVIPATVEYEGQTYKVASIGRNAFMHSFNLKSITIPETLSTIDDSAFEDCMNLQEIIVEPTNTHFLSFNKSLYNKDQTILIKVPAQLNTENYTIPETVITIGSYAFQYCQNITSVTIPESVTTIGKEAFNYCHQITSITLPESVTSIGEGAFKSCSYLTSINLPEGITSIERDIFSSCHALTSIKIPEGVTSIGAYAFYACSSLTTISIPAAVTSIGVNALNNCSNMKEILVDPNNEYFSTYNKSLYSKDQTVLLVVPDRYENQNYDNFSASIKTIGESAFWHCEEVTSITIPITVTTIEKNAFSSCSQLTTVNIPDAINTIEYGTFSYCKSLKSIIIPKNVELIDQWAFRECSSLLEVYSFNPNAPQADRDPFYQIPSEAILYVPRGSLEAYTSAEGWSQFSDFREMGVFDVSLSVSTLELLVGASATISATIEKDSDVTVGAAEWSSSDSAVATVDDGNVTAVAEGTAVICYTVYDGYGVPHTESCNVTVTEATAVKSVFGDDSALVDVYTLNGVVIARSVYSGNLNALPVGLYIVRQGATTCKIAVK